MSLSSKQIEGIAHLARLELDAAEIPRYVDSLSSILGLVSELERVNTDGIAPMAHPLEGQVQRLRADAVSSPNLRDLLQANAPQVDAGLYVVPKVIE
jgi:aspartyl-tRNA(Asn)/glutamyl-tRNA(Gln) amidotransferase subunit C